MSKISILSPKVLLSAFIIALAPSAALADEGAKTILRREADIGFLHTERNSNMFEGSANGLAAKGTFHLLNAENGKVNEFRATLGVDHSELTFDKMKPGLGYPGASTHFGPYPMGTNTTGYSGMGYPAGGMGGGMGLPLTNTPSTGVRAEIKGMTSFVAHDIGPCTAYLGGQAAGLVDYRSTGQNVGAGLDTRLAASLGPEAGLVCKVANTVIRGSLNAGVRAGQMGDEKPIAFRGVAEVDASIQNRAWVTAKGAVDGNTQEVSGGLKFKPFETLPLTAGAEITHDAVSNSNYKDLQNMGMQYGIQFVDFKTDSTGARVTVGGAF